MFNTNPLEYRVGVTVEAEQDQNWKISRWPAPRCAVRCDTHYRATTRNFPVIAEKSCTLSCIEHAVSGMREFPGNPPFKWRKRSKKAAPPGFPNRNSTFALATGKPGWRLDSYVQPY
ncbi:hypothetical protein [Caballeronia sordidicola]|jgi:hypothetical protein|uniref:hypothetical protein n=1 Tax=Caballeronia sordidicola TaxID=196367 RepID=UPI0004D029D4|nr:hypothetical protein [Caballeronia sordidicola]